MRISLLPVDPVVVALGNRSVTFAEDGSFTLAGVPQGKYRLQASVLPNSYLKTVRMGEQDITKTYVDLTGVVAPEPLNLLFSARRAMLGVIVIFDSDSSPRGTALFVPQPYPADPKIQATGFTELAVDQSGYDQSNNMPPGRYRVYAFENYDPVEGISELTLQRLESKSEVINLVEGGYERVNVKPIRPTDIPQ